MDAKQTLITIDGSQGEGGGQIFRTTLSLSMCLGIPVRIENIRAGRGKPGLLRQHLTCLRAAKAISDADVIGDQLGSMCVEFYPGKVKAGDYCFAIGSAGSASLVFQTIMMPLLLAEGNSEVELEGGTHNSAAPSYDFIVCSFLPLMKRMGYEITTELIRYGFYPAGGGAWNALISPTHKHEPLSLLERGALVGKTCVATSARLPKRVLEREVRETQKHTSWNACHVDKRWVDSPGPGNILSLQAEYGNITEVIEVVGEKNTRAEKVARNCLTIWDEYAKSNAPVGEHLADQLLLPLLLGQGGIFRTGEPSMHLLTNIDVIKMLTGITISIEKVDMNSWEVTVPKLSST